MFVKKFNLLALLLLCSFTYSQSMRIDAFGKPSQHELKLKRYDPEPDASGVILYEAGNYYAVSIVRRNAVRLVKEIHRKIKVLDANKFYLTKIGRASCRESE